MEREMNGDPVPVEAAALGFDAEKDGAPRLLARGRGSLAEAILRMAREYEIPVVQNAPVAGFLQSVPDGHEIPENLYRAVASIFAMLYRLEGKNSGGKRPGPA